MKCDKNLKPAPKAQCAIQNVVHSAYDWETEQKKNFCRNRECPFYDGWSYGCKQRSDARKCAARDFY